MILKLIFYLFFLFSMKRLWKCWSFWSLFLVFAGSLIMCIFCILTTIQMSHLLNIFNIYFWDFIGAPWLIQWLTHWFITWWIPSKYNVYMYCFDNAQWVRKIKKVQAKKNSWNQINQKVFFREIAFLAVLNFFQLQKLI